MNKPLEIYFVGTGILVAAIILNSAANAIGITTWHGLLSGISGKALIGAFASEGPNLIFLFIAYPLALGAVAYYLSLFLKK